MSATQDDAGMNNDCGGRREAPRAIVIRPSTRRRRAGDAGDLSLPHRATASVTSAMLASRAVRRRGPEAPAQEHAQAPAAASRRRVDGASLGYAYAVPFRKRPAYRFTRQAFDLCPPRPLCIAASARICCRADRRLRRCRLPPDDRLYRQRQRRLAAPARKPAAFARSAICRRWPTRFGQWADTVMVQRAIGPEISVACSNTLCVRI